MASQNIARLGIVLGVDSGELVTKITEAQQKFGQFKAQIKRDSEDAAKEIVRLEMATRNYGKTLTEVEKIEEQIRLGKYKNQPDIIINNLKKQAAAYDQIAASAKKAEQAKMKQGGGMNAQQQAALGYQTTDIVVSLAGGQNPLMVLLQQGGQLRDQFGGFKPLFQGIATAITPMRLAVAGFGGAVLGLGYAFYKGAEESSKFRDSMILTGQYAGIVESQFNQMSKAISVQYGGSIGKTREIMQELVSSGQFTATSLTSVAAAISKVSSLSGQSGAEAAKNLIPLLDGSTASAKRLSDQYHALTFEQYKHIEALNAQGKIQEAIAYSADALTKSLAGQERKLGDLERMWESLKKTASSVGDWFLSFGREMDKGKEIQRLAKEIETWSNLPSPSDRRYQERKRTLDDYIAKYTALAQEMNAEVAKADEISKKGAKEKGKIDRYAEAGGAETAKKLAQERAKIIADINFQEAATGLDRIGALYAEFEKKVFEIKARLAGESSSKKLAFGWEMEKNAAMETFLAYETYEKKIKEISDEKNTTWTNNIAKEQESLARERQRLDFLRENIFATKEQIDLDNSRLQTMQKIAELNRESNMLPEAKAAQEKKIIALGEEREALIRQQEELTRLQNINQTVFSNMGNAIDNFVRTGKLSFASLAKSIIQDLIAIQLKAQAVSMFSSFMGVMGFGGKYTPGSSSFVGPMPAKALGGPVVDSQPYLVGERGPEMFIPRNSGTIIPHDKLMSGMGATTNVTNNYINAIDTKSFEQRLLGSSNTIWAANQYAGKSLAASGGRS